MPSSDEIMELQSASETSHRPLPSPSDATEEARDVAHDTTAESAQKENESHEGTGYSDGGDEDSKLDRVAEEHNLFLAKIQTRTDENALRLRMSECKYLDMLDETQSTVLHLMGDTWDSNHERVFHALMQEYPDLFRAKDELSRTLLDRGKTKKRRLFLNFFVKEYLHQTKELVEAQPSLLTLLLSELRDPLCWELLLPKIKDILATKDGKGYTFLHNAILRSESQQEGLLQTIVSTTVKVAPKTLESTDSDSRSAYKHAVLRRRQLMEASPPARATRILSNIALEFDKIIDVLRLETFRRMDANKCRDLLYEVGDEDEFDLDLAELANSCESIDMHALKELLSSLRLQPSMRVVSLPHIPECNLDSMKKMEDWAGSGVGTLLRLISKKGVRDIMELQVDDDIDRPCKDQHIERAIRLFVIDRLDWRKTDICLDVLLKAAPNLTRLHLYSSGNHAVLKSWAAADGLPSFTNLEQVEIDVLPRIESPKRVRSNLKELRAALDFKVRVFFRMLAPGPGTGVTWSSLIADTAGHQIGPSHNWSTQWERVIGCLKDQVSLATQMQDRYGDVKVAVIDDGVDVLRLQEQRKFTAGISFDIEAGRLRPWYFSSANHGTMVTKVLLRVFPWVKLSIARINMEQRIESTLKALKWAVSRKVDIIMLGISVAPVTKSDIDMFRKIMHEADEMKIIVFGPGENLNAASRGDGRTFLSISPTVFSITTPRQNPLAQKSGTWFMFPDDFSSVSSPETKVSDNSVSTAVAVGFAALVLFCNRGSRGHDFRQMQSIFTRFLEPTVDMKLITGMDLFCMPEDSIIEHVRHICCLALGQLKETEKLEAQALETRKSALGADNPDPLVGMTDPTSTLWNQGRADEAEKIHTELCERYQTQFGAEHPTTLACMAILALVFKDQGRLREAEQLQVQVLETRKKTLGADHPDTLASMIHLASTIFYQGRWEDAEKLELQVMEIRKETLGPYHPSTVTSMANLACTYGKQGRWEEAEKLQGQVLDNYHVKLEEDHPLRITSVANLASTYGKLGRWEEAEKLQVRVLDTCKGRFGPDHRYTLMGMHHLAYTLKSLGRSQEALDLMRGCATLRLQRFGQEHPDTQSSMRAISLWRQETMSHS